MADFFKRLGMRSDIKLDWQCSACKRKFKAKCNVHSHIAQSRCKLKGSAVNLGSKMPMKIIEEKQFSIVKEPSSKIVIPALSMYESSESSSEQ